MPTIAWTENHISLWVIVSILRKLINGTIKNIYLSKISQQKIAIQYCHYGLPCIVTQLNRIITYLMFQHTFSLKLHDFSHQFINIKIINMKISEIINLILERMRSAMCTGTGTGIRGITEISCVLHHHFLPLQVFYTFSERVERCLHVSMNL